MPWLPEFSSAVELARAQTRAAGRADPVGQYFRALNSGATGALEDVWPGEVVIHDPRAGEIRGHKQLRQFVAENRSWMAEHLVRTDLVAATCADGRAVVELLAHLVHDGQDLVWPLAVVAESPNIGQWCSAPTAPNGRSTGDATSGRPYSSPGVPTQVMSSADITPRWTLGTPMRS